MRWIASMLEPVEPIETEPLWSWWPFGSEHDDRQTREKIEEQREADFYREDPDDMPLDEDERTPDDAAADAADRMRDKLLAEEDEDG
jgi:hypothetical protein